MPDDPLLVALYNHHLLTTADVDRAVRYREAKIALLQKEIELLNNVRWQCEPVPDIRDERDPPLVPAERGFG